MPPLPVRCGVRSSLCQPALLLQLLLLALALALPAYAQQLQEDGSLHVPLSAGFSSSSWQRLTMNVEASHTVRFSWLLPQGDAAALRARFESVSQPSSPLYLQHMQTDEIKALLSPDAALVVQPVRAYLARHGVQATQVVDRGDYLAVTTSVQQIEALFNTTMHVYQQSGVGDASSQADQPINTARAARLVLRATDGLTVPASLVASTRLLVGLVDLPVPARLRSPAVSSDALTKLIKLQRDAAAPAAQPLLATEDAQQHSWHTTQVASTGTAAPYTPLSCALYGPNRTLFVTGADFIQAQYGLSSRQAVTGNSGQRVGIVGGVTLPDTVYGVSSQECWSPADVINIGAAYGYQQQPLTIDAPYARVNALLFEEQHLASVENSLDAQSVYLTSPTASLGLLRFNDDTTWFDLFESVLQLPASQRPTVITSSIIDLSDADPGLGADLVLATDSVLMQLGVAGVTVLFASGDNGAVGANQACTVPPPANFGITGNTSFVPSWPSDSPYVLSVGATDFLTGLTSASMPQYFQGATPSFCGTCADYPNTTVACQSALIAEQAVSVDSTGFSSSGGFSTYASAPSYQQSAVNAYLSSACTTRNNCKLPPTSYYNSSNRGFPDVSIFGGVTPVGVQGFLDGIAGTSESAPIWAGVVARLNEVSMALVNRTLGFINPLLYRMQATTASLPAGQRAFNDIVIGDNVCPELSGNITASNCKSVCQGYYTAPGWDPVTGLGSPNVTVMIAYLTALLNGTALRPANASSANSTTIKTYPTGGPVGTVLRVISSGLSSPSGLVMSNTSVLVADYFVGTIVSLSSAGVVTNFTTSPYGALAMSWDPVRGVLYQLLDEHPNYLAFNVSTGVRTAIGATNFGANRGLAVQPGTGNLFVTARFLPAVAVFTPGNSGYTRVDNANFVAPYALAFSADGSVLYVGDQSGGQYNQGAVIAISLATGNTSFIVDDTSDGFALDFVTGLTVDSRGNIYAVDQGVGRVVILSSTGAVLGSLYGAGADTTPGNSLFSADGFVLPYSVAVDPRGYYIYVSDGAAGNVVQMAGLVAAPIVSGSTRGDPQFSGFLGQSFQVHGVDGEVYSLISDALVQVNGRFSFLGQRGDCVAQQDVRRVDRAAQAFALNSRVLSAPILCWSHPGSYISELSVRTAEGARLRLVAGTARQGFAQVALSADDDSEDDEVAIELTDGSPLAQRGLIVSRLSSHHVLVQAGVFSMLLSSSDGFLNLDRVDVTDWPRLTQKLRSHGLLGQTWDRAHKPDAGATVRAIQGDVDDYVQAERHLFGVDNAYNMFAPTVQR